MHLCSVCLPISFGDGVEGCLQVGMSVGGACWGCTAAAANGREGCKAHGGKRHVNIIVYYVTIYFICNVSKCSKLLS